MLHDVCRVVDGDDARRRVLSSCRSTGVRSVMIDAALVMFRGAPVHASPKALGLSTRYVEVMLCSAQPRTGDMVRELCSAAHTDARACCRVK